MFLRIIITIIVLTIIAILGFKQDKAQFEYKENE